MDAIVITAAPAMGKSTLFASLAERIPGKAAFLDGDEVGRLVPFRLTREWLDLVQDNIAACAANFADCDVRLFVTAFCLPSQERVDRLICLLEKIGYRVHIIALVSDEEALLERNRTRGGDDIRDAEEFASSLECNRGIRELQGVTLIDTTSMSVEQTASQVLRTILDLTREKRKKR
jgi:dephospho-CoA kinase